MKFTLSTIVLTALTGTTLAQIPGGGPGAALGKQLDGLNLGAMTGLGSNPPSVAVSAPIPAASTPAPTPSIPAFSWPISGAVWTPIPTTFKRKAKGTPFASTPSSTLPTSSAVPSSSAGVLAKLEKLLY
ncbi:hypothetical protein N7499_011496 [Penicillium canescens]|uniref:Uncharacterized protein n=1 Tax=Penicillium canescens TaxID=5083 RepID=A0AAD6IK93_PENCN|nr:uncharacterized protein N7446_006754 [Penicillium canescens]KAJ6049919.1 hypothetical protein N7444_006635 [Penicillium canescens]KAJ6052112.1 hypothetical protein N7460_002646 [Penicillium canescens]KAJ6062634.1 hypothetical protein N7446_006754 [Penicillium canescens]KAJ6069609.1 hypothetical protein N7499_011496 [Penicillium canescens]KAJ6182339.1 hypothetical protein N7485_000981 [Penicillium canescens]